MLIGEFMNVKKLGFGQFGMVHLCVRKAENGKLEEFAMKVVCK